MLIEHNPDEWTVDVEYHVCEYHKKRPEDRSYAGCSCSGSYTQRRKTKEEKKYKCFGTKIQEVLDIYK